MSTNLTFDDEPAAIATRMLCVRATRNEFEAMSSVSFREDGPVGHPWSPRPGSPPGATFPSA